MPDQAYPMVGECTDRYEAVRQADSGVLIRISVPPRFADLWLVKLTELTTTDAEIAEYEPPAPGPGMMNQELRFRLQTALLGEVGPALRGVAYRMEAREVCIRFYFDGPVGDEDRESASCVVTEVIAGLPEDVRVTEEVIRLDAPARIPATCRSSFTGASDAERPGRMHSRDWMRAWPEDGRITRQFRPQHPEGYACEWRATYARGCGVRCFSRPRARWSARWPCGG